MLGSMFRAVTAIFFVATGAAMAQQDDPGASATEIKLGQTVPFSGPVSVAGVVGMPLSLTSTPSTRPAESMAGRSSSSRSMMATPRRKPSRPLDAWSRTTTS